MIRTTPFYERTKAANTTGLWTHWSGYLVATKYQMSEKFEYFAIRNAAAVYDSSPLYKYRIRGSGAQRYLAGVLARDITTCRPGRGQYTIWCDDDGYVMEDGVIFCTAENEYLLTAAKPNLAYLQSLIGYDKVEVEDVSAAYASVAVQGPRSREILAALAPSVRGLAYFEHTETKIGDAPLTVSRTGFTGDLGYELWMDRSDALRVWDVLFEIGSGHGLVPNGDVALLMARIEAGLLLVDADFESSRFAWNDAHRSTPIELGLGWMFRNLSKTDRPFIGREAIRRELAGGPTRWRMIGLVVDWRDYEQKYSRAGLIPPKDHTPVAEDMMVYDADAKRVGYATSFMYSPVLQRHIALARVRPDLAAPGNEVNLEFTIDHRYEMVAAHTAALPLYDPPRRTA
ncbi:MAG: aminomethyltransferase family protein [Acidimicrobiia bacterium]|nr:aminomethyltransferase family protein [Acidimicrobiia bacterium]